MAEKSLKYVPSQPYIRQGRSTWESLPANLQYFHSKNPNSSSAKPCKISSSFGFYRLIFTKWTSRFTEAAVSVSCRFVHHVTPPFRCCNYCGYSISTTDNEHWSRLVRLVCCASLRLLQVSQCKCRKALDTLNRIVTYEVLVSMTIIVAARTLSEFLCDQMKLRWRQHRWEQH